MRNIKIIIVPLILSTVFAFHVSGFAKDAAEPDLWGVAIGLRGASVPYAAEDDHLLDVMPMFFYEKGRIFINGLEAGFKFYDTDKWRISALGRYRFFDMPTKHQDEIRRNSFDMGGQVRYYFTDYFNTDLELLSDAGGRRHASVVLNFPYKNRKLELLSSLKLRWKNGEFNNTYYGLTIDEPGSALDFYAGVSGRFHVHKNLYLIGNAGMTVFDDSTYKIDVIDDRFQGEYFLGFGFFNDRTEEKTKTLFSKRYVRLAHGWAIPSSFGKILSFNAKKDTYNNQMTSLFYGQPVSDHLFGLPIQIYLTPGYILHHESEVQKRINEFVFAIKAYYTIKWPVTWRLGVAEGLSYVNRIPYVEQTNLDKKDLKPSQLLNYLDFSLDIELGDLFNSKMLEGLWLGCSIHHRSGLFQTSSAFGRIKGGSNVGSLYLQYHW